VQFYRTKLNRLRLVTVGMTSVLN